MKKHLKIIFLSVVIITFYSCRELVGPIEPVPGSRNYQWKIDTLSNLQGYYLSSIQAFNSSDVWACFDGYVYHYDGNKWNYQSGVYLDEVIGTPSGPSWGLRGASSYGINVRKYEGNKWSEGSYYKMNSLEGAYFLNQAYYVHPEKIYATGVFFTNKGHHFPVLLHYNGSKWGFINTPLKDFQFIQAAYDKDYSGRFFVYGVEDIVDTTGSIPHHKGGPYKIYELIENKFYEVISSPVMSFSEINGLAVYIKDNEVIRCGDKTLFKDFSGSGYNVYSAKGRSIKDIFFYGNENNTEKHILHYNGKDLVSLIKLHEIMGYCITDRDIFVVGSINNKVVIAHGILRGED